MSINLGVHVPIAGGLLEAVGRAKRLRCTTMQIFSRSPRGGKTLPIPRELAERFDAQRRAAGLEPLAVHGPYIINLASPEAAVWKRSLALYRDDYARAAALGARYLVTHVGSHRGQGEPGGIARVAEAVSRTLDGAAPTTMILLENTAGSGQGLGYTFEQLAAIREAVPAKAHVGVCLDTAHLFAAGYPIQTDEGLEQTLAAFDRAVGFAHLRLIHLNDSKAPFNSRVDRHWHIGEGHIGREAFRRIVTHPRLRGIPFILETPKTTARPPGPPVAHAGAGGDSESRAGEREDRRNLATVRRLAQDGAGSRPNRLPRISRAQLVAV
ncbi:MAG: deoxyribonuclease IV [Candidatus Omnitrophica bacterium]|nr:deoxyribonuclease IV [Candidatus Omnitrophota bacterium]